MKLINIALLAFTLAGCGSTAVKKIVDLPSLPEDHPVTVYTELPNFRYEVICEIDISREGSFVSTNLSSYKSNIEVEARKCGTDKGLLVGLNGTSTTSTYGTNYGLNRSTSYDIVVQGYGIRQTSEVDKLSGRETIKSFGTAVALDNITAVQKIVKDVNKDSAKRSFNDDLLLTYVVFVNAQKGFECPKATIDYLVNGYGVWITKLNYGSDLVNSSAKDLALCGNLLTKSYLLIENRPDLLTYINNSVVGILNYATRSKSDLQKLEHLKPLLSQADEEIRKACIVSETSEICLFKKRFQELRESIKKITHK